MIYPPEYFCPLNYYTGEMNITENSRSIHHYMATWTSKWEKRIIYINRKFAEHKKLAHFLALPLRVMNKFEKLGLKEIAHFAIGKLKAYLNFYI